METQLLQMTSKIHGCEEAMFSPALKMRNPRAPHGENAIKL